MNIGGTAKKKKPYDWKGATLLHLKKQTVFCGGDFSLFQLWQLLLSKTGMWPSPFPM